MLAPFYGSLCTMHPCCCCFSVRCCKEQLRCHCSSFDWIDCRLSPPIVATECVCSIIFVLVPSNAHISRIILGPGTRQNYIRTRNDRRKSTAYLSRRTPRERRIKYSWNITPTAPMLLQCVYRATVVARLTYAASAWRGFTKASDRQRINTVIERARRLGYCSARRIYWR